MRNAASRIFAAAAARFRRCPRSERLQAWAEQHELRFEAVHDALPDEPYHAFSLFKSPDIHSRELTMSGSLAFTIGGRPHRCDLLLGDIRYEESDDGDWIMPAWYQLLAESNIRHFSYLLVRLPFERIASLRIRHRRCPGGTGDGVYIGQELQQFEWDEFNQQAQVASDDKRFTSNLICKDMMEFIFEYPAWPIAIERGWLSMTDGQSQWTPTDYGNTLDWLHEFLSRWPEHLVASLEAQENES